MSVRNKETVLRNESSGVITLVDIPKIDEMLACLCESKSLTSLDLRCRYYYIKLSPEQDIKVLLWQSLVNMNSLECLLDYQKDQHISLQWWEKLLGQFNDLCFFCKGNILVHDSNETYHLVHPSMILIKIREAALKPKLSKCTFVIRVLQYIRHLISGMVYTHWKKRWHC